MRAIIWSLLLVSAAVGLALLMRVNHGNVAIFWPPYRLDVSVNLALVVLVAGFAALHLLLVALANALDLPARVREFRSRLPVVASRFGHGPVPHSTIVGHPG